MDGSLLYARDVCSGIFSSFPLRKGRVHEVCGPGAYGFAFVQAAHTDATVFWIAERWRPERLNPLGVSAFSDPGKLLLATVRDQDEALAVAEDALRDGAAPLVVAELGDPPGLTAGRRLQLAAKAGAATGLCLIPEGGGSNAAETRWHCAPLFDPADSTLQRWRLIKNKSGTLGVWDVRWDAASRRLDVVSAAGERPGSEDPAG